MSPEKRISREFTYGLLDGAARIYPTAVALRGASPAMLRDLKRAFGGTIDGNRWVVRGVAPRIALLRRWAGNTVYREHEIALALEALEARADPLDTGPLAV